MHNRTFWRISVDAPKPLGYWLQHLHNLLENHFALALSDLGTNRREWQLLNTLAQGPRTRTDLEQALAPFWTADEPSLQQVLAIFAARGWTEESNSTVTLTRAGAAAHAELLPRVDQTRAVVLQGLTPDRYRETVQTLAVMAGNVEAANASRTTAKDAA
jgi:DNA-binding MarR family transcriptional regulator